MSISRVVAITGCDSGLGWSVAARSAREGFITIAGMYLGTETNAAQALKDLSAHPLLLDVTKPESVTNFRDYVRCLLQENSNYSKYRQCVDKHLIFDHRPAEKEWVSFKLHAIVNNAGVMAIGNYEWHTPSMIENTINVNLIGAMRVTSAFLPDLRRSALDSNSKLKPRIINVASHCGLQPLPGFGPYSASKAGLLAWTHALRYEHRDHGLAAAVIVPGGFITASNILAGQGYHGELMLDHLDEEQKSFYGNKITALTDYLRGAANNCKYDSLKDVNIIETFMKTLLDDCPKEMYKVESLRYKYYYNLLKLPFPEAVSHFIIKKFLRFPD